MNPTTRRFLLPVVLVVCALFVLSACTKTMDAGKVEKSSKNFLRGKLGDEKFNTVKCPSGVEAKEGKNFTCTFKGDQGTTGTLNVEVNSSDGDATITVKTVKYTHTYVETGITKDFGTTFPDQASALASVACPDDIPTKVGDTFTCTLTDNNAQTADLTVTLTKDLSLDWDFNQLGQS